VLTYKTLNTSVPQYLSQRINRRVNARTLRSTATRAFAHPAVLSHRLRETFFSMRRALSGTHFLRLSSEATRRLLSNLDEKHSYFVGPETSTHNRLPPAPLKLRSYGVPQHWSNQDLWILIGESCNFSPLTLSTLDIFVAICNILNVFAMYDVVEIVQFSQPNVQCMRSAYTFYFLSLIIFSGIGLGGPRTHRTLLATPMLYKYVYYIIVIIIYLSKHWPKMRICRSRTPSISAGKSCSRTTRKWSRCWWWESSRRDWRADADKHAANL